MVEGATDVVVVGGGIAGLSAALIAARDGWSVQLVDSAGGGGRLLNVEELHDYPHVGDARSGPDLAAELIEAAMDAGVDFAFDEATGIRADGGWVVECADAVFTARTVVVATGQSDGSLGVSGEDESRGRGVSYCASCDAPLFAGKRTIVVGSGDWAVDEAVYLTRYAAQTVLVCPLPDLRCTPTRRARLGESPIEVRLAAVPAQLLTADGTVSGLVVTTAGGPVELATDGVFPMTGQSPALSVVPAGLAAVRDDRMCVDAEGGAGVGLFAAGDVTKLVDGLAVEAAAEGQRAGRSASVYLTG